jgi:hypothetical protein
LVLVGSAADAIDETSEAEAAYRRTLEVEREGDEPMSAIYSTNCSRGARTWH